MPMFSSRHVAFHCCRHVAQFHREDFYASDGGQLANSSDVETIECGFDGRGNLRHCAGVRHRRYLVYTERLQLNADSANKHR